MVEYWKQIITDCWDIYKNNYRLLLSAHCILILLYIYPQFVITNIDLNENLFNLAEAMSPSVAILCISLFLLNGGISLGAIFLSHNAILKKDLDFKQLFQHFYLLPQLILKYMVSGITMLSALYFFSNIIFASLVFVVMNFSLFFFYDYIIVIKKLDFKSAIQENFNLVSKNIILISQYCLLSLLITLSLSILPILGIVLGQSFIMVLGIQFYRKLSVK